MEKEDILNTLEELGQEEFKKFKWFLQQPETLPDLPTIRKIHLEGADTLEVVDLMVQIYRLDRCREVTCRILKKMKRNDLRNRLIDGLIGEKEAEVQEMIQERQMKIQEIRESVKISRDAADREKAEGVQVFSAVKESAERRLKELIKEIQDKHEATEKQAEDVIRDLEQEISELKERSSEVKQLYQDEDPLHLLQSFSSLKVAPPTETWTEVRVHPPYYEGTVVRAVVKLGETISEKMEMMMEVELKRIQQFAVDVTLDPYTAHPNLILSHDRKMVKHQDMWKNLPDNPERFSVCLNILGQQSFSSGRFYFEVQVKGKTHWDLGVVRESVDRKGLIPLSPQNGFWIILLRNVNQYLAGAEPPVRLHVHPGPEKVGVFVDYDQGLVSFYDVDAADLIYSFTGCCFKEKLYPYFGPGLNHGGENSAPLIICPVGQAAAAAAGGGNLYK